MQPKQHKLKLTKRNFNACENKKCAALTKRKRPAERKFKKLEKAHCMPLSDNDDFFNCSNKFYTETGYEKIANDLAKCADQHCKKEKKERADAYGLAGGKRKTKKSRRVCNSLRQARG